jgi:hypothetical protein
MPARVLVDATLGNPTRARYACTSCSQLVYLDQIDRPNPVTFADYVLRRDCPRKPRCQPWKDRGCVFVTLDPRPAAST